MAEDVNVLEGYGVKVLHGAADGTMTELPGVLEVEPPESEMDDIETQHMQTPGRAKTYKPGWLEPGEMSVTLHYDPAVVASLHTIRAARLIEDWRVEWLDTSKFTSKGYIKSIGTPVDREQLTTVEITVKLSGEGVYDEPAPVGS